MIRVNDEFVPPGGPGVADVSARGLAELCRTLRNGPPAEQRRAMVELVALGAEDELTRCLAAPDPLAAKLATMGLWECWLNEEGPEPRIQIEGGIQLMDAGELPQAQRLFSDLSKAFPGWAEPVNKQATVLYRRGRISASVQLYQLVLDLKPTHFAAWHTLGLCAVRLRDWQLALEAGQEALRLHPNLADHRRLVWVARAQLQWH